MLGPAFGLLFFGAAEAREKREWKAEASVIKRGTAMRSVIHTAL